jgi:MinD superfamily P-loop ATPase
MKEIAVISGKGGTGKTSIAAALASAGSDMVLCDCDVDAADLHLIMHPDIKETHLFEGGWIVKINAEKCADCGICSEYCRFDAITRNEGDQPSIDPYKCEDCRLCERICPSQAITSSRSRNNSWFVSDTRCGLMVHALMGPGEENSGKLVSVVRKRARELADQDNLKYILTDGPPGTGCATIASVTGADAVLVVIEPSITSLHDARRVIELVRKFDIPVYAMINKYTINSEMVKQVETLLETISVPLLGKLPFDRTIVEAMIHGKTILEFLPESESSLTIHSVWSQLKEFQ